MIILGGKKVHWGQFEQCWHTVGILELWKKYWPNWREFGKKKHGNKWLRRGRNTFCFNMQGKGWQLWYDVLETMFSQLFGRKYNANNLPVPVQMYVIPSILWMLCSSRVRLRCESQTQVENFSSSCKLESSLRFRLSWSQFLSWEQCPVNSGSRKEGYRVGRMSPGWPGLPNSCFALSGPVEWAFLLPLLYFWRLNKTEEIVIWGEFHVEQRPQLVIGEGIGHQQRKCQGDGAFCLSIPALHTFCCHLETSQPIS